MSVELIRRRWCDACPVTDPDGDRVQLPEDYVPVMMDLGHGRRILDVCDSCTEKLTWLQIVRLYVEDGRPMKSTQTQKIAPLPTVSGQSRTSPPATAEDPHPPSPVQAPVRTRGDTGTRDNQPCPFCNRKFSSYSQAREHILKAHKFDPENLPPECPLCSLNEDRINTVGGARMHITRRHGVSLLGAFLEARRNGDPRGSWAKVEALRHVNEVNNAESAAT